MADPDTLEHRVLTLIEAYGAEPGLWPEADRTDTNLGLLASPTPAIAAAVHRAEALDALLETLPAPFLPIGLEARVLEHAPSQAWWRTLVGRLPQRSTWLPASSAFASLMVGLMVGLGTAATPSNDAADPETEEILYAALGYSDLAGTIEGATE